MEIGLRTQHGEEQFCLHLKWTGQHLVIPILAFFFFIMLYKTLEGKAQSQAGPYFESGGEVGRERAEGFIAFLDRGN